MHRFRHVRTVALLLVCAPLLAGCKVALDHHLTERQSNAIVALLLDHGIPAGKSISKTGQFAVDVEQQDFAAAYALQRDHGLPRATTTSAKQIFGNSGLVASPQADAAKLVFAEDQQIAQAISSIDGVINAHVIIVPPRFDPLSEGKSLAAASVLVSYAPHAGVNRLVPQIKMLVADGVRGLSYNRVTVVMVPGASASAATPAPLENILGIWVAKGSGSAVRALLALTLASIAALIGLAGLLGWRRREILIARGSKLLVPIRR